MPPRTLVDGYTYLVLPDGESARFTRDDVGGLYHRDTRYLSTLRWSVDGRPLGTLQSTLVTPAFQRERLTPGDTTINDISEGSVPKHSDLVARRETAVAEGRGAVQRLVLSNHTPDARTHTVGATVDVDFADLFEVRGFDSGIEREVTMTRETGEVTGSYEFDHGGERTRYTTHITTDAVDPTGDGFEWSVTVPPQGTRTVDLGVGLDAALSARPPEELSAVRDDPVDVEAVPATGDDHSAVLEQAAADLTALTTGTEVGPVPLAGTPWFVTPFGRDALLTAYQTLPVAPALAVGTLRYFARHRGTSTDPVTEAEPGKIFHEQRNGELATRGLIPHTPYFGTVDATPLWVVLLAETCGWHDSLALAAALRESLHEALEWVYRATERGPDDVFVYYESSDHGLTHKAWKDTADSIRAADGTPVDRPLAVAEVQSYASRALAEGARLLDRLGTDDGEQPPRPVDAYTSRAAALRRRFDEAFWLPDREFYGVARTGTGEVVDSVTSNIGHCLWMGTIPPERVAPVADRLTDAALAGGWGLRTLSAEEAGYSPVSYHAGGVWPHDTSLAALGLSAHGYGDAADTLARHVLDAAASFPNQRLPELYCGFDRAEQPTMYPAACTPQAWGAGAPFAFLRASLGLQPDGDGGVEATRSSPVFPAAAVPDGAVGGLALLDDTTESGGVRSDR
jgi:glycogen debranching enzyme